MPDNRETGQRLLAELSKTFNDEPVLDIPSFVSQIATDFNGATHAQKLAINHLRHTIRPSWRNVFWDSLASLTQGSTTVYEYDPDNPFSAIRSEILRVFPTGVETYHLLVGQTAAEFLERSARNLKVKQVLLAGMGFVNSLFPHLAALQVQNQAGNIPLQG